MLVSLMSNWSELEPPITLLSTETSLLPTSEVVDLFSMVLVVGVEIKYKLDREPSIMVSGQEKVKSLN